MVKTDRIVLVRPGPKRFARHGALLHLPLNLLSLAAWLSRDTRWKDRINVLDMQVHDINPGCFEESEIVGITAMTGPQIHFGLIAAQMARAANPHALIIWGGVHPSLLPEQTTCHDCVDVVVIGEGEETFSEVVEAHSEGKELAGIPGTCVKAAGGEVVMGPPRPFLDMDSLPLPRYDLVDLRDYPGIEYQFDYQSSRGCPFDCGFCYNTVFSGRKWRGKSAEKVVDELEYLKRIYPVKNFAMADDEFFLDDKRTVELFGLLVERGFDRGIVASCRLDIARKMPDTLFSLMRKAGVMQMFFGAESGSDEMLDELGKGITTADIIEGSTKTAEAGIRPILSFMSGFPGETPEQFEQTLGIIDTLRSRHPLITINGIFPFNAYPGTGLFADAMKRGFPFPKSMEEWGAWTFQYEPDSPWLNEKMRHDMQICFYIIRFWYYLTRLEDRHRGSFWIVFLKLIVSPLMLSGTIRWKMRWFRAAWEWRLFAAFARGTFGYL